MKSRENDEERKKSHTYKHLLDRPKCIVKEKAIEEGTNTQDSGTVAAAAAAARLIDADFVR